MAYTTVNVGTTANDNTGDPIRTAFQTLNANFVTANDRFASDADIDIAASGITGTAVDTDITITANGTGKVILAGATNTIVNALSTPASNVGVAGDTVGDVAIDATYIYICVRDYDAGADAWLRSAIFTTF